MKEVVEKVITNANGTEVSRFDYTGLEPEMGNFLKEKASRIVDFSIKSVMAIGKELKAAQEKLASHDKTKGVFIKWVQSLGLSDDTAYNYIHTYTFVSERFGNIESAKEFLMLPQKLQYEVSKPNAPAELIDNVLSGDITTHKEYKALEEKLKNAKVSAEELGRRAQDYREKFELAENDKRTTEKVLRETQADIKTLQDELKKKQKDIKEAKSKGDSEEVKRLQATVLEQVDKLEEAQEKIVSLEMQLKDKPIEVPATKEVIPDAVRLAIYEKVSRLYEGLCKLTETEIQIFAEDVSEDYRDDVIKGTEDAAEVLADIAHTVWKQTE